MKLASLVVCAALLSVPVMALGQEAKIASGGVIRVLDKLTGKLTDLNLANGQSQRIGHLLVTLGECRVPLDNPAGDAFASLAVHYRDAPEPVFLGWMIASAPGVSAMDHARYDVWPLRCTTS